MSAEPEQAPPSGPSEPAHPPITTPEAPKIELPKVEPPKAEPPKAEPFTIKDMQLPEGLKADEKAQGQFVELVNKYGISREAAKDLVGLQSDLVRRASEANTAAWDQVQDQWRAQVTADSEIGGSKTEGALTSIAKLLDRYGEGIPSLRQTFDYTGAGNHPDIVKFLSRIAKDLTEGGPISGGPPASGQPRDPADILFGQPKGG
jgi:hypothetical protein